MIKNYFKIAVRNLQKNKLFTAVNIIGLSIGIASVMALSFSVYQYLTTDRVFTGKEHMFFLKTTAQNGDSYSQTTYPLLGEIVKTCPEVEAATHTQSWNQPWLKYGEKEVQEETMYVDSGFLKVFTFPLKYGNAATAFNDKYSIVISDKVATALFGNIDPIGKIISADDSVKLTVTGVLAVIAGHATIKSDVLLTTNLLMSDSNFRKGANWYNGFAENFIRLKASSNIALLETKINKIVATNYVKERSKDKIKVVSFNNIKDEGRPLVAIIIKGSLTAAIFILLIIVFNLINLNAATMFNRSKEVGVRQMMGSGRQNIIIQFCIENGLLVFFSIIAGTLLFIYLLLPQMNKFTGDSFGESILDIKNDYPFLLLFIFIGIIITTVAGSLPAMRLCTLKITDTVKGRINIAGSNFKMRNFFITIQFTLAIIFIGITVIFNRQMHYMKSISVGFNKENIVVVNTDLAFKDPAAASVRFTSILSQLKTNPYVKSVATGGVVPTKYWEDFNDYADINTNKKVRLRQVGTCASYLPTFEIPLIEGRNFDDNLSATEGRSVIINTTAMKAFGWKDIVGKTLRPQGNTAVYTVVGVMKDFNYQDTQSPIEPLVHSYIGKPSLNNKYFSLNIVAGHQKEILQKLENDFKEMPSRRPFKYSYMSDLVDNQYVLLNGILSTTNFIAFLTILVAGMGMFGLISLLAKQKVKEIGVRKVLGASMQSIVTLLSKDFLLLVIAASVIALPVCWFIMDKWLADFAYHVKIQWWMLVLTSLIAMAIALVTVSYQSIKASMVNPVKSLKSE